MAVLPFRDLSPERDQGHLALGFTQDVLAELVRFRSLDVLSGNSLVQEDGGHDSERAADLGVDFILEGSVRRHEDALRVSAQLLEVESGRLPWAETFDERAERLFDIQDEIVGRVVGALATRVDERRLHRARRAPLGGLDTYDCWLRGLDLLQQGSLEADLEARTYFSRAVELDPSFARAWAGLSLTHFNEWSCQVWHLFEENESAAYEHARRAAELDDGDAIVHLVLARVQTFRRDFEGGEANLERALALNPNDPHLLAQLGLLLSNLGDPERALNAARKARRLNPGHPLWYHLCEALPLYLLRRFEEALVAAIPAQLCFVDAPAVRAAAAAQLGDLERARQELLAFDREFRLKVTFGREPEAGEELRWLEHVNPFRRPRDFELLIEGLEAAGFEAGQTRTKERPAARAAEMALGGNLFKREGEAWTLAFEGTGAMLAEIKGFHDLARLLATPDEPVHCCELHGSVSADRDRGEAILDSRARREIEARMQELRTELEAAGADHDLARSETLRSELETLVAELERTTGLGGRGRRLGDDVERARTAVTWRIRSAIKKISVAHPRLGRHLNHSIRTGTFCVYAPESRIDWEVVIAA